MKMWPLLRLEPGWLADLQQEVMALQATETGSRVEDPAHPTHWVRPYGSARQFNLYNALGRTDEFAWANAAAQGKRFWLEGKPALERLVNTFSPHLINFRLNELHPNSGLNPHEEPIESREGLILRFHIPVFTNDDAWMVLDEERFHFEPGVLYYFNKGCVHAAINNGTSARYHFVFDMHLTDWTFQRLFDPAGENPPDGFLRLSSEERDQLADSVPFPVNEYVEGTASGEVLLFRKEEGGGAGQFKKSAKITKDICDAWALTFGRGWWGCEEWEGQRFRWAAPSTELEIEAERDGMALLRLHVAAGPSAPAGETVLTATDSDGAEHGQFRATGEKGVWEIRVAVHRGQNRVVIGAQEAASEIPGESRLLSFRAFSAELNSV